MDRRDELRKAMHPRRSSVQGHVQGPSQPQTYARRDPRFVNPAEARRAELLKAFGVKRYRPGESVDLLHRGKIIGPPWMGGIFQTRLNWGTLVLAFGVVLFIVWLIMRAQVG